MNRILKSDTREPVQIGDTLIVGNGWEMKIERLPQHPGGGLLGYRNEEGAYREIALDKVGLEFEHPHRVYLNEYGGNVLVYEGLTVQVQFMDDDDQTPPWQRGDGYGIVLDWTERAKHPGERVLQAAKRGYSKRYYDWQASIARAKDEGWDAEPRGTGTKSERAVRAVEADFKYHQGWCEDEWRFVVIRVECADEEDVCGGFETYQHYHVDAAWEMIEAIVAKVKEKQVAAAIEQARLQDLAQQIWNLVTFGVGDKPSDLHAVLTEYNQIVVKAGLQPVAIDTDAE